MKEVVVLSGKGGTGKTSLVGSFAALAQSKVLAVGQRETRVLERTGCHY
jgi:MinD superfamily P-loop ATPase